MVSTTKYHRADIEVFLDCHPKWRKWFTLHSPNQIRDWSLPQILPGRGWHRSKSGDQEESFPVLFRISGNAALSHLFFCFPISHRSHSTDFASLDGESIPATDGCLSDCSDFFFD
jgi:hypothetical protein